MKNLICLFLLAIFVVGNSPVGAKRKSDRLANNIDGLGDGLLTFLGSNIKYPTKAKYQNLQGNSILLFTLNNGKLSDISIHTELGAGCDVEVLNKLLAYPGLNQEKNGKYALKVGFRLHGSTATIENQDTKTPEGYTSLEVVVMANSLPVANATEVKTSDNKHRPFTFIPTGNSIAIRGLGMDPIVVIDDQIVEYALMKELLPENIKSITILRKESAVLQYGPNAINGAIIILTKNKPALSPQKTAPSSKN